MRSYLTYEQLDSLIHFADDDKATVDAAAIEALCVLNYTVQKNIAKRFDGMQKRNRMLQERLEKYQQRDNERIEAGCFEDTDRDSLLVARALLYQLQQRRTYKLTKVKVNIILYEMYASWLYSKKVRLFKEHPVAAQWGPMLWHAVKALNVSETISHTEWKQFASQSPAVAALCKGAADKYYDINDSTLINDIKATKAYKKASAENNDGKWGKEILDADIFAWKRHQDLQSHRV